MALHFDIAGRLSVTLDGSPGPATERWLRAQLDPFAPGRDTPFAPSVSLRVEEPGRARHLGELQNPARDGLTTASGGETLFVLAAGRTCSVPEPLDDAALTFAFERGFPLNQIFRQFVRPAMQTAMLAGSAVAVHATAVELDGRAVLVAGWSESGKTETALALMERGASFLSDKWVVVGEDGAVSAFPISVGIRGWVLRYLPRLRSGLPRRVRAQLAAAAVARSSIPSPRKGNEVGRLGVALELFERAATLGDRATLTPSEVRQVYGQDDDPARRVPLGAVALLRTVPGERVEARVADPLSGAIRLAQSAAHERREYFQLERRAAFAYPGSSGGALLRTLERETTLLDRILKSTALVEIDAPFPGDPRAVADSLLEEL